jgi:hypothetical protein
VKTGKRKEYFLRRASSGCSNCKSLADVVDPISKLCSPCKKSLLVHGSPRIKKPKLKNEMEWANLRVALHCKLQESDKAFNRFMLCFASPTSDDPLKRLCWLNYFELKGSDGNPVMDFRSALIQSYAVNLYEVNGGRFDSRKKQYQYCLGRSVVCPWNGRKRVAQGFKYNKRERIDLQRKPTIMHRAFDEIFMGSGLARYLTKITNKIRN